MNNTIANVCNDISHFLFIFLKKKVNFKNYSSSLIQIQLEGNKSSVFK